VICRLSLGLLSNIFLYSARLRSSLTPRGGSQRVVDEAERSVHDALMVIKDVLERPDIVAGGVALEAYIANELRGWSSNLEGRAQLAVQKFTDALDSLPLYRIPIYGASHKLQNTKSDR
jgi:chaperonin GroEL (HSP60 family)